MPGTNLTTGNNNVDIGNAGIAGESNTIRIGKQGTQTAAHFAGIFGTMVTGDPVLINSTGKLGMVMSSARFKRDIQDMGNQSGGLQKLRPVTFRYKGDATGTLQYGLVAEEVARVYPELISYGPDGKPLTVHYLMLTAMLLNEVQKQAKQNERQAEQIQRLTQLSDQQAVENRQLSTEVAQLSAMFEQAIASHKGASSLAAAFNR